MIGLIGIAIGFALGVAVASLRGESRRASSAKEAQRKPAATAARRPATESAAPPPEIPAAGKPEPAEMPVKTARPEVFPPTPEQQLKRAGLNPVDVISFALRSEVRQPEQPPASIAVQIDEILQEKLAGTELVGRGIKLLELPGRGLVFIVGLNRYEDVEAVPDPEIRGLIRESVAEWERRQEIP
jgi:hypothetical protein